MPIFIIFRLIRRFRFRRVLRSKIGFVTLFFTCMWFVNALLFYYSEHVVAGRKDIDFITSLYWSIITMATIGYGDVTPIKGLGWLVAGFAAIMGILAYTLTVSVIADAFLSASIRRAMGLAPLKNKKILVIGDSDVCNEVIDELVLNDYGDDTGLLIPTQPRGQPKIDYMVGDPGDEGVLRKAGVDRASHIILCMSDDDKTLYTALLIRHINKDAKVSAIVSSFYTEKLLREAGVKYIVSNKILGRTIASAVFEPLVLSFITDAISVRGKTDLIEITSDTTATVEEFERKLMDKDRGYRYRIIVIHRNGKTIFLPDRNHEIRKGDKLVAIKAIKTT